MWILHSNSNWHEAKMSLILLTYLLTYLPITSSSSFGTHHLLFLKPLICRKPNRSNWRVRFIQQSPTQATASLDRRLWLAPPFSKGNFLSPRRSIASQPPLIRARTGRQKGSQSALISSISKPVPWMTQNVRNFCAQFGWLSSPPLPPPSACSGPEHSAGSIDGALCQLVGVQRLWAGQLWPPRHWTQRKLWRKAEFRTAGNYFPHSHGEVNFFWLFRSKGSLCCSSMGPGTQLCIHSRRRPRASFAHFLDQMTDWDLLFQVGASPSSISSSRMFVCLFPFCKMLYLFFSNLPVHGRRIVRNWLVNKSAVIRTAPIQIRDHLGRHLGHRQHLRFVIEPTLKNNFVNTIPRNSADGYNSMHTCSYLLNLR